ncbi:hypothetical protein [Streptomyces sp. Agncl-13]|uniref:hypothetical protein n=1 Tax=Streptomyces sp. Agncl-13 TaxID=3400628 RepID=UPI003A83C328
MNTHTKSLGRLLLAPFLGACLLTGCGDSPHTADSQAISLPKQEKRARQVADAWRGSASATAWNEGYYPMGDAVQIPESGWHSKADERAYATKNFVLRGSLPTTTPDHGTVEWGSRNTLPRPLWGAQQAYRSFALNQSDGPQLTVTGARLGTTTITTSRGPATVPAWLFTLKGYDTPLKRVAVTPSKLPKSPIGQVEQGAAGGLRSITRLAETAMDDRSITVKATHGACDDGPVVKALESEENVVLYASIKGAQSGPCNASMTEQSVKVELRRSLGDRTLLDALTGQPVPYGEANGLSPSWT